MKGPKPQNYRVTEAEPKLGDLPPYLMFFSFFQATTLKNKVLIPSLHPKVDSSLAFYHMASQHHLGSLAPENWLIQISCYIQGQTPTPLTNQFFYLINIPLCSGFPSKQHA